MHCEGRCWDSSLAGGVISIRRATTESSAWIALMFLEFFGLQIDGAQRALCSVAASDPALVP
jgi:hypothetical protein